MLGKGPWRREHPTAVHWPYGKCTRGGRRTLRVDVGEAIDCQALVGAGALHGDTREPQLALIRHPRQLGNIVPSLIRCTQTAHG